mmetsp:Transcript_84647/g.262928  ORF Transcript_84647/g.262928 Transcript_84647/m.262928 type:complete len:201 (+) Transcript_84647:25-627(+)
MTHHSGHCPLQGPPRRSVQGRLQQHVRRLILLQEGQMKSKLLGEQEAACHERDDTKCDKRAPEVRSGAALVRALLTEADLVLQAAGVALPEPAHSRALVAVRYGRGHEAGGGDAPDATVEAAQGALLGAPAPFRVEVALVAAERLVRDRLGLHRSMQDQGGEGVDVLGRAPAARLPATETPLLLGPGLLDAGVPDRAVEA